MNEHMSCELKMCELQLEQCRKELIKARVSSTDDKLEGSKEITTAMPGYNYQDYKRVLASVALRLLLYWSYTLLVPFFIMFFVSNFFVSVFPQNVELKKQLQNQLSTLRKDHQDLLNQLKSVHSLMERRSEHLNTAVADKVSSLHSLPKERV